MSYHIYTTDGIILKRTNFGEANVLLHVLTQDLGLIMASARSARLAVSKLRPALQEYAYVSLSAVRGKGGWKITNVADKGDFYFGYEPHQQKLIAQIGVVLLQMIAGESVHPEIFTIVKSGFEFARSVSAENISYLEILLMIRILYELGYVVSNNDTEIFLKEPTIWTNELLQKVSEQKKILVGLINKALTESQL